MKLPLLCAVKVVEVLAQMEAGEAITAKVGAEVAVTVTVLVVLAHPAILAVTVYVVLPLAVGVATTLAPVATFK